MNSIQRVFLWSFLGAMLTTIAWRICGTVWGISGPETFPLLHLGDNRQLFSSITDTIIVFFLPTFVVCAVKILSVNRQGEDREGENWFFCGVGSIFGTVGFAMDGAISIVICLILLAILYLSDKVIFDDGKIIPLFPALFGFLVTLFLLAGMTNGWLFPWAILVVFPLRSLTSVRVREILCALSS
jgi:hypothetical protein